MSVALSAGGTPILLRLTTPQINVKHGALTANKTFNTNLQPALAFIIRKVSFVVASLDAFTAPLGSLFITAQVTENTTNTSPNLADPLAIASFAKRYASEQSSAVGFATFIDEEVQSGSETFGGYGYPTVAATLNLTAQIVETQGTGATNGFNISAYIWYQIAAVDSSLQAYLSNRLALQR